MSDLLPCPFCGCSARVVQEIGQKKVAIKGSFFTTHEWQDEVRGFHVECNNRVCLVETPTWDGLDGAIAAWNTRTPPSKPEVEG